MLFSDQRSHKLSVPKTDSKGAPVTVGWLVNYLCDEIMQDSRKDMFVLDDHVWVASLLFQFPQCLARHGRTGRTDTSVQPRVGFDKIIFGFLSSVWVSILCDAMPLMFVWISITCTFPPLSFELSPFQNYPRYQASSPVPSLFPVCTRTY